MKNIPIPLHTSYKLQLIDKIETVIKRMCWKAHFFLDEKKKKKKKEAKCETSRFKSRPAEKIR